MGFPRTILAVAALSLAGAAQAETIEMKVNGMMCNNCVQAIEKSLRSDAATADVLVNLEAKVVAVAMKPGASIADDTLRKSLKAEGYDVKEISRTERPISEIREQLKTVK
jgi:mercuric ion binding protein